MAKAVWPETGIWEGGSNSKVCQSDDERIIVRMALRYGIPETWNVLVIVYGPGGKADERQGWIDMTFTGTFDEVVQRAKETTFAAGLATTLSS